MKSTSKAVQKYEEFQKTGCSSLMSAMSESAFTAAIGLTGSTLTGNFMNRDVMNGIEQRSKAFQSRFEGDLNDNRDMSEILKHPEMREQAALTEVITHEMVHGLQKHAYRSVFTFVEALQTIELIELQTGIIHASQGDAWEIGESYLQSLDSLGSQLSGMMGDRVARAAEVALAAQSEKQSGLSMLHLIEGQAHVASRVAIRSFDHLGIGDVPSIYTNAWDHFVRSGGNSPLIFVLITGAALRYGDIEDGSPGSSWDFLPHPVDIYIYILRFVPELEEAFAKLDRLASNPLGRFLPTKPTAENHSAELAESTAAPLIAAIESKRHLATDSPDDTFTFLKCKESPEDFDDEEEMNRIHNRIHHVVWDPLEALIEAPNYDRTAGTAATLLLAMERLIATIIESTYTRLAEPLNGFFDQPKKGAIATAVGHLFSKAVPDYCNARVFHRLILDREFTLGKLVGFFMNRMREEVKIQPFDSMDPMFYYEYQGLRQIPESIKKTLEIYAWRNKYGEPPSTGPYCCETHGCIPINSDLIVDLEKCKNEDSTGQLVHNLLHRTVGSLFKGI